MQIVHRWAWHYGEATWHWFMWQVNVAAKTMMGNNGGPHAALARAIPTIEQNAKVEYVYLSRHKEAIDKFLTAASPSFKRQAEADESWVPHHEDRVQGFLNIGLNPRTVDVLAVGTPVVEPGALGSDARYRLQQQTGGVRTLRVGAQDKEVQFDESCKLQIRCGDFQITRHDTGKSVTISSVVSFYQPASALVLAGKCF